MKKYLALLIIIFMTFGIITPVFAGTSRDLTTDLQNEASEKLMFSFSAPFNSQNLWDLGYDTRNQNLYVIKNPLCPLPNGDLSNGQYVYDASGKLDFVSSSKYAPLTTWHAGIEFDGTDVWTLESSISFVNHYSEDKTDRLPIGLPPYPEMKFSARKGALFFGVDYYGEGYSPLFYGQEKVTIDGPSQGLIGIDPYSLHSEMGPYGPKAIEGVRAFGLSPDGKQMIYAGTVASLTDKEPTTHRVALLDPITNERSWFIINQKEEGQIIESYDLYATENRIVILWYNKSTNKAYIQRYSYEGDWIDEVEVDPSVRKITEGPEGSTIYVRSAVHEMVSTLRSSGLPYEAIQITWPESQLPASNLSTSNRMKPLIHEVKKQGQTLAVFEPHQFGLLKQEDPETGNIDFRAPIRSQDNNVSLRIPYCDIQEKREGGARNLMVEYQGQTLTFPMELFNIDDMLAAMPCQTDATIEIIMQTDEAAKVTYEVQLFVVEQVNEMTRVIHRNTIQ